VRGEKKYESEKQYKRLQTADYTASGGKEFFGGERVKRVMGKG